ncbi:hypothetical protein KR093_000083 [Drosophila rubida]|uniref:Condensin complex subunit 2 n=1 Tax=Drosophila rubida TaxID=30044 RepID=A0AAD4PMW1_9MUSC|nr:hypothetical protein KR093_000083 [Drosophila rubida]
MTLPRSETSLRRSAVGSHRESMIRDMTTVNDDDAERLEARRRTLFQQQTRPRDSSVLESIEENETIKKCLEIYNGNKLSRDNAWTLSLIDTLSNLLDRHHKTLSNFKMAGSSLEASSRVYGLRVDSIYLDAMRMSAGLSARTLTEQQLNAAADRDDSIKENAEGGVPDDNGQTQVAAPKAKKRPRKAVSTVTKNKDTLNMRLDTAPLQDPVFGKLNSTVGSINASNRLMHNILPTVDSELKLRTNYRFWNSEELPQEVTDYTMIDTDLQDLDSQSLVSAEFVEKLLRYDQKLNLRPLHTGYIITDEPNPSNVMEPRQMPDNDDGVDNVDNFYENPKELSMAFDINAECEPMPELDGPTAAVLEVDYNELEELTTEERQTLQNCRMLRKQPVVIDDLRPIDGSTKLEYSYRPMDKISQFWAGPSHWKFKRSRARSTFGQVNSQENAAGGSSAGGSTTVTTGAARAKRGAHNAAKRRSQHLKFGECTEHLFQPLETNIKKLRKANCQKRWDARKLMLPTKYEFDSNYFYKYDYAPSIKVSRRFGVQDEDLERDAHSATDECIDDVELFDNDHFNSDTHASPCAMNISILPEGGDTGCTFLGGDQAAGGSLSQMNTTLRNNCNDTVLEIATDFEGAPTQVTKVIVPFAKRAKVIDMKNLKRSCNCLIQKQLLNDVIEESIPIHLKAKQEHYAKGMASFKEVYDKLPNLLTTKMADSLSPSVALYAVLHLANDMRLRLIPQDDFENFTIRQVTDYRE